MGRAWLDMSCILALLLVVLISSCDTYGDRLGEVFRAVEQGDVDTLRSYTRCMSPVARAEAIRGLARNQSPEAAEALVESLTEMSAEWRREMLVTLLDSQRRDPQAWRLLCELCKNSEPSIRSATLVGLGQMGPLPDELTSKVLRALEDPSPRVCVAAASALRDQGWLAVDKMASAMQDATPKTSEKIASLLAEITGHKEETAAGWKKWV